MTYHPLTKDSGGSEQDRVDEAHRICRMLEEFIDQMNEREKGMIDSMENCDYCSTKQLFYLRDISERYL